jgi:hypothetical protein
MASFSTGRRSQYLEIRDVVFYACGFQIAAALAGTKIDRFGTDPT